MQVTSRQVTTYKLLSENGNWQIVQSVRQTQEPLSAYNLTVNNDHTYFVTGDAITYGVWVHNDCWNTQPKGYKPSDVKLANGKSIYVKTNRKGEQTRIYEGDDGRWYDKAVHAPNGLVKAFETLTSSAYTKLSDTEKPIFISHLTRQMARQEKAINSMTADEFVLAVDTFKKLKRNPEAVKTQRNFTKNFKKGVQ